MCSRKIWMIAFLIKTLTCINYHSCRLSSVDKHIQVQFNNLNGGHSQVQIRVPLLVDIHNCKLKATLLIGHFRVQIKTTLLVDIHGCNLKTNFVDGPFPGTN